MRQQETYPWQKHYGNEAQWNITLDKRPLFSHFDKTVAQYPNHIFLDFLGKTYKYKEVDELVSRAANGFQKIGVKKGQHVGLLLPNCPHYVICFLALLKVGATVVNCNPLYTINELKTQLIDADVTLIITPNLQAIYGKVINLLQVTPLEQVVVTEFQDMLPWPKNKLFPLMRSKDMASVVYSRMYHAFSDLLDNDGKYKPVPIDPEKDIAVIQYTGGTTGRAKGAMLSHYNLYANTLQASEMCSHFVPGEETILAVLPFFHIFALTAVLQIAIVKGAKVVIHPRFDIDTVIKDIRKKKITMLPAVPTMFVAINHYDGKEKRDLSSLKSGISGGAGLPVSVKEEFEKLSGAVIMEGYGLTESSPVASFTPPFGCNKDGSIGIPLPHTIMSIVDLEDKNTLMPIGEKGEVCIAGPQVMKGYWQGEDNTDMENPVTPQGRLHTGDIGYMDADGYFYIVDRLKEMIICGGVNIYPRNIETEILKHPYIKEAAVIGVDDEYKGQLVKLYVSFKEGESLTEEEVISFLKKKLSSIYLPSIIEFKDELPKTLIGKIDKKSLL